MAPNLFFYLPLNDDNPALTAYLRQNESLEVSMGKQTIGLIKIFCFNSLFSSIPFLLSHKEVKASLVSSLFSLGLGMDVTLLATLSGAVFVAKCFPRLQG